VGVVAYAPSRLPFAFFGDNPGCSFSAFSESAISRSRRFQSRGEQLRAGGRIALLNGLVDRDVRCQTPMNIPDPTRRKLGDSLFRVTHGFLSLGGAIGQDVAFQPLDLRPLCK
jgi:hypothetical protein